MKKVYAVIREEDYDGCPSQDIMGIFTEKESAQKFIDSFDHAEGRTIRIEEYLLNPFQAELEHGLKCYFLRMKKDGIAFEVGRADTPPNTRLDLDPRLFPKFGFDVNGDLYCRTYAKDEKHAIRICNKKRLSLIAQNKWPQCCKPTEFSWSEVAAEIGISEEALTKFAIEKGLIDESGHPTQFALDEGLLVDRQPNPFLKLFNN
jgi:hypothetical protein